MITHCWGLPLLPPTDHVTQKHVKNTLFIKRMMRVENKRLNIHLRGTLRQGVKLTDFKNV